MREEIGAGDSGYSSRCYFFTRLLWLATHNHLPSWNTQVSVKRPEVLIGLARIKALGGNCLSRPRCWRTFQLPGYQCSLRWARTLIGEFRQEFSPIADLPS